MSSHKPLWGLVGRAALVREAVEGSWFLGATVGRADLPQAARLAQSTHLFTQGLDYSLIIIKTSIPSQDHIINTLIETFDYTSLVLAAPLVASDGAGWGKVGRVKASGPGGRRQISSHAKSLGVGVANR
jgi:hypothetical protein